MAHQLQQKQSARRSSSDLQQMTDVGLLVLRLFLGLALATHGAQKLFGWFNGNGLTRTGGFFEKLGYEPGGLFAFIAGTSELIGGLMLAAGFLTPLAAAMVIGVMLNAVAADWKNGFYGGFELALLYAAGAATLAFTGPGRLSLDHGQMWQRQGSKWAALSLALGVGAALLTLAYKAL